MDTPRPRPWLRAVVAATALAYVVLWIPTLQWPMVFDGSLMAYIGSRLADGAVPYRDVFDMNAPGTYLMHLALYQAIGTDDVAWRAFDVVVLLIGCAATYGLARPAGRDLAALAAVGWFGYHHVHGAYALGERDFVAATLALVAGWLIVGTRLAGSGRLVLAGFLAGFAGGIKPNMALFGVALIAPTIAAQRDDGGGGDLVMRDAMALTVGGLAAVALQVGWLATSGALGPLQSMLGELMPVHTALRVPFGRSTALFLLEPPVALGLLCLVGLALAKDLPTAVRALFAVGLSYGLFHWYQQGKAWDYHASPFVAFTWPSFAWLAARARGPVAKGAIALFAGGALLLQGAWAWVYQGPQAAHVERLTRNATALAEVLDEDDTVQIIGDVGSGIQVLADQRRPMATPYVYDFHFYERADAPEVQEWRNGMLALMRGTPPDVVLVSVHSWPSNSFARLEAWPELTTFLDERYALVKEDPAYRIYRLDPDATP